MSSLSASFALPDDGMVLVCDADENFTSTGIYHSRHNKEQACKNRGILNKCLRVNTFCNTLALCCPLQKEIQSSTMPLLCKSLTVYELTLKQFLYKAVHYCI